ncbi:hypothetical protein Ancab_021317 [Ancistrocladus abbreviatus]
MRRRIPVPLLDNSIHNFALQCFIPIQNEMPTCNLEWMVDQLKAGIIRYAKTSQEKLKDEMCESFKELDLLLNREDTDLKLRSTTSWCRLIYYEVDFRWGKLIWASPLTLLAPRNCIVLWDSTGDGIQAWVTLKEEVMDAVEFGMKLLSFTSLNPSAIGAY